MEDFLGEETYGTCSNLVRNTSKTIEPALIYINRAIIEDYPEVVFYSVIKFSFSSSNYDYEGCSNMNASSFITFFTYICYDKMSYLSGKNYLSPL